MDARLMRLAIGIAIGMSYAHALCPAAGYRTRNFVVQTPDPQMARAIAEGAEEYRKSLAVVWLGEELPDWRQPCPIVARVSPKLGAGGVTSFMFERGQPFDWRMTIEGPPDRVLDSVLPHEVTHTIFATYFGGPLPRWADEGACTTVENPSERSKHHQMLYEFLTTNRGIPFNHMIEMSEYPPDILPLYAQGHAVVEFLLQQGGHRKFIGFMEEGMQSRDWNSTVRNHYQYRDLSDLQVRWVTWIRDGRPALERPRSETPDAPPVQLAQATGGRGYENAGSGNRGNLGGSNTNGSNPGGSSWYSRQRALAATKEASPGQGFRELANANEPARVASHNGEGSWSSSRPGDTQRIPVQILEWDGRGGAPPTALLPGSLPQRQGLPYDPRPTEPIRR